MKRFQISDKYAIAQFDERNWVIERSKEVRVEKRKNVAPDGQEVANTGIYGYYRTLKHAREVAAELVGRDAGNFTELDKWVSAIERIKA